MYQDKRAVQKRIDDITKRPEGVSEWNVKYLLGYIAFLESELKHKDEIRIKVLKQRQDSEDKARWAEAEVLELKMLLGHKHISELDDIISFAYDSHLNIKQALFVNTKRRIACWLVMTLRQNGNTQLEAICSIARQANRYRKGILNRMANDLIDSNPVVRCWIEPSLINHLLGSTMYGKEE